MLFFLQGPQTVDVISRDVIERVVSNRIKIVSNSIKIVSNSIKIVPVFQYYRLRQRSCPSRYSLKIYTSILFIISIHLLVIYVLMYLNYFFYVFHCSKFLHYSAQACPMQDRNTCVSFFDYFIKWPPSFADVLKKTFNQT